MSVPTFTHCPDCNTPGKQEKDYGRVIAMVCPKCGRRWSTVVGK